MPADAVFASVQELGSARTVWQLNAQAPANPASLMKLVTTSAALDSLGPAWQWTTPVWLAGPVRDGVLEGHLHIKGTGDPKLVVERVWLLLKRVQQFGVRDIQGDIVIDRSAFAASEASTAARRLTARVAAWGRARCRPPFVRASSRPCVAATE